MTTEIICKDKDYSLAHVDAHYEIQKKDGTKVAYSKFLDCYLAYLSVIGWKDPGAA